MRNATQTDTDAERARRVLLRRRRVLLAGDDERSYELSQEGTAVSADPIEQAEATEAVAALGLLSRQEQREFVEIEVALERLACGRWGLCEACGHAIGHQLLRSSPERRLCLACELD